MELEHLVGISVPGHVGASALALAEDPNSAYYAVGRHLIRSNLSDPHDQSVFADHTFPIATITISPDFSLLASATEEIPTQPSEILVRRASDHELVVRLAAHPGGVRCLTFSSDARFLASVGASDGCVVIWSLEAAQEGQDPCVTVLRPSRAQHAASVTFAAWAPLTSRLARPSYVLCSPEGSRIRLHTLRFNRGTLAYEAETVLLPLPPTGLVRSYTCGAVCGSGSVLFAGTASGEVAVFSLDGAVFRTLHKVCSGPVAAVVVDDKASTVHAAERGPAGTLTAMEGSDMAWRTIATAKLPNVRHIGALLQRGDKLYVASGAGCLVSVSANTLANPRILATFPEHTICAVVADPAAPDRLFVGDTHGCLSVWSLETYSVASFVEVVPPIIPGAGTCGGLAVYNGVLFSVWGDGSLHAHDVSAQASQAGALLATSLLHVPAAHRGAVTSLAVSDTGIATGGADGVTRVWAHGTGRLVVQVAGVAHPTTGPASRAVRAVTGTAADVAGGVTSLAWDVVVPSLLHILYGQDASLVTFDLKLDRRIKFRTLAGPTTSLAQLSIGECEVVTADLGSRVTYWDFDLDEPSMAIPLTVDQNSGTQPLAHVAASPDSKLLAVVDARGSVAVLEAADGRKVGTGIAAHPGGVSSVTWTADGQQIVTAGLSGEIAVWNLYL
jgi:WD40 repeat protein